MSYFVYVSHTDPVHALTAARELMERRYYPFVPQLNKLIPGRKDAEWENYYKMWLFKCDVLLLTPSYRPHERAWAEELGVPVTGSVKELDNFKLPPFLEVGRRFGTALAKELDPNEGWRKTGLQQVQKDFERMAGIGADEFLIGLQALKVWDLKNRKVQ